MPMMLQHHDLLPGPLVARAARAAAARASLVVASVGVRGARPRSEGSARRAAPGGAPGRRPGPLPAARSRAPRAAPSGPAPPWCSARSSRGSVLTWLSRPSALAARELPGLRLRLVGEPIGPEGRDLIESLRRRAEQPDLRGRVELVGRVDGCRAGARGTRTACSTAPTPSRTGWWSPRPWPAACRSWCHGACGPQRSSSRAAAARTTRATPPRPPPHSWRSCRTRRSPRRMGAAARAAAERRLDARATRARYAELVEELRPRRPLARLAAAAPAGRRTRDRDRPAQLRGGARDAARLARAPSARGAGRGGRLGLFRRRRGACAALARRRRHVLELGENVGFGRGVNAGLALVDRPVDGAPQPRRGAARRVARRRPRARRFATRSG